MKTDFAQLNHDVVFGRSGGKIIWQPRIHCWYTDKQFAGQPLPTPYTGLSIHDVHRKLGCSARLYEFNACFKPVEHPKVRHHFEDLKDGMEKHMIDTPVGTQVEVMRKSVYTASRFPVKWEVQTEQELKVATWRQENMTWQWDQEMFDKLTAQLGNLGAPTMWMPRMNIQSLYIEKMGVENGILALYDWTDTVEAYFKALEQCHDRLIDVINACPIEIINFGENIHSGTLTPKLFKRYHLPTCQRRCEKLHAAGKFVSSHWDGDCASLLCFAKDTGLDAIEAITPQPQGDVTLDQIKQALGDELFLIDGLPAVYFDETYSVETLIECTNRLIELFAPRLILGISDEISSTGDIERIRIVSQIVDTYNAALTK